MINAPIRDYDITTMCDDREFIFFNASEFTCESARQKAKEIQPEMGYGHEFNEPTVENVELIWIKDNPRFKTNTDEQAYFYSDPSSSDAYLVIGVELIYND